MNQHTADLIEAIENHPVIDLEDKPEYSTLAAAYAELQEMALELVAYAKKTDELIQSVKAIAIDEVFGRKQNVIARIICEHESESREQIAKNLETVLANKTVTVEQSGDVTITGTINQPKL